jgi:hypothetical protein
MAMILMTNRFTHILQSAEAVNNTAAQGAARATSAMPSSSQGVEDNRKRKRFIVVTDNESTLPLKSRIERIEKGEIRSQARRSFGIPDVIAPAVTTPAAGAGDPKQNTAHRMDKFKHVNRPHSQPHASSDSTRNRQHDSRKRGR